MYVHIVRRNETLWHISQQYGTTIDAIVKANKLENANLIRVGQQLLIPGVSHPDAKVPVTPEPNPVSGSPYTFKSYTNLYNGRPARVFIVKFPVEQVEASILYNGCGPPFKLQTVSGLAREWGADLAVNASFFYGGYPLGRHIKAGHKLYDYPHDKPTIISDNWRMDTWYDGISRLLQQGVQTAFSSYPYLMWEGNRWISKYPEGLGTPHPRTAIGLSRDRKVLIVAAIDGRQPGYSLGVTLKEEQRILENEGAWAWILNCDGGGSTTMWFRGRIINRPSYGERPVVNALAFKVKP